ncbi:hypothetical protein CPC08DRAFT_161959 [Agrocybe pediades]|nr:hypothetical protein CPC08DRAFT_161959 [Agrocybe pediades]
MTSIYPKSSLTVHRLLSGSVRASPMIFNIPNISDLFKHISKQDEALILVFNLRNKMLHPETTSSPPSPHAHPPPRVINLLLTPAIFAYLYRSGGTMSTNITSYSGKDGSKWAHKTFHPITPFRRALGCSSRREMDKRPINSFSDLCSTL